jgi:cytochrome c oxidase subunit II
MVERFLTGASSYAPSIDHLIFLVAALVGFWLIVAEGFLFGLVIKFRHRDGQRSLYITGEEKHLRRWITIPHLLVIGCDIVIIVFAIIVWVNVKQDMPPAQQTVRVFGQQWSWSFQLPGKDGILDTADDIRTVDELHVEVNTTYHFELMSRDVVHSFAVPAFRLKQDAVPGRTITGWFKATRLGTYDIQCTQLCGVGHALMAGRIIVETPQAYAAWVSQVSNTAAAAAPQPPMSSSRVADAAVAEVRP